MDKLVNSIAKPVWTVLEKRIARISGTSKKVCQRQIQKMLEGVPKWSGEELVAISKEVALKSYNGRGGPSRAIDALYKKIVKAVEDAAEEELTDEPKIDEFLHCCFIEIANELWKGVDVLSLEDTKERKKNSNRIISIVEKGIEDCIYDFIDEVREEDDESDEDDDDEDSEDNQTSSEEELSDDESSEEEPTEDELSEEEPTEEELSEDDEEDEEDDDEDDELPESDEDDN